MTVAEYLEATSAKDSPLYELHHGELVEVSRPKKKHAALQIWLYELLRPWALKTGQLMPEMAFQALPEYDLRAAHIGYADTQRWNAVGPDEYLQGAPDMVIEILSPSNTAQEMLDRETICLENGCREFWVLDARRTLVRVSKPDGTSRVYRSGQRIPLTLWGDAELAVDDIFATVHTS
jgi:Uma2 family endonuclease